MLFHGQSPGVSSVEKMDFFEESQVDEREMIERATNEKKRQLEQYEVDAHPFELTELNNFETDRRTLSKNYKKSPPFSRENSRNISDTERDRILALSSEFHTVERMNTQQVTKPDNHRESEVSRMLDFDSFEKDSKVLLD
jgi:hypothetical protein